MKINEPKLKEYHYYGTNIVRLRKWCLNGKHHRVNGPAVISYYEDSSVECQHWYFDNRLHRMDGPAMIFYNEDGSIYHQQWYLNGRKLYKKDFISLDTIKRMNAFPLFTVKEIARLKLDKPI